MSDLPTQISKLINDAGATFEQNAICSSWLLITEWVDGEGRVWLEEHRTSEMPAWKRLGILYYVLDTNTDYEEEQ